MKMINVKKMKRFFFFLVFLLLVNTVLAAENASVVLHGEKTDVVLGEDIILKLSAVNIITEPVMTVQAILIPPSGMSVTSSEFVTSGAGQFTSTFKLDPGAGKDIEVRIKTNQAGDFNVTGRVIYFFGDDKSTKEDYSLNLPIVVRIPPAVTETPFPDYYKSRTNPRIFLGFVILIFIFFVVVSEFFKKKDNKAGIKKVNEIRNILLYFLFLLVIAYGLTGLFKDSREMGYISTLSDISPNFKELWFSLLTFCFGAFYGGAVIVAWFDWKKRLQVVSILASSLIVAFNFFHVITLRFWLFVIGLITFAFITHIFRSKEGEYIKYQISTVTIAVISIISVWLALLNYIFGRYDADTFIRYFFLAAAFSAVFYKFSIYEISNLKLFILGHRNAGKTVFVSALYEEAFEQKRTIGDLPKNLDESLGILRKGSWPPANAGVKPYDFRYVHGNLFAKEVNIDIDYSGELFEKNIDKITKYLENKKAIGSISPEGDIQKIADAIYHADKLIFIIDPDRINKTDDSGDYIKDLYMPILREVPGRSCYLLITKSDKLYGDEQVDRNYENFRKYVIQKIEKEVPFYKDIKVRAKAVLPVFIYIKDDEPVISNSNLSSFGFDKVLDVIGK